MGTLSIFKRILQVLGRGLLRIAVLVVPVFAALLIALLPVSTAVPSFLWLFLACAVGGLVIALFWFKWNRWVTGITLVGSLVIMGLAVASSQAYAITPLIADALGNVRPGSIAALEKVALNGSEQWISIRGNNVNNPVLLFLAGGPGGSQLATARRALGGLEEHFVVVNWEQPGAGKSFDAVDRSTMTPERYIADGHALALYLRQRFDEDKIYVLGESWGSVLGIWLVQRYPELFHAFIGTGQMVAFLDTDLECYDFAMQVAAERGDAEKVRQLRLQGPPPYYGEGVALKEAAFLMETYDYMNQDPAIADDGFNTFQDLASPEYGSYDKLNWFRGALDTLGIVYPQLWEVDLRKQATHLEIPIYFLIGRHDVNAPPALTEAYYELLNAPHKELIWFEHSGHNPWVTESSRFVEVTVTTVLKQTYPKGIDNGN